MLYGSCRIKSIFTLTHHDLCLQSNVAASNAKLALFYDWLFFSPEKDSIMNIGNTHTQ